LYRSLLFSLLAVLTFAPAASSTTIVLSELSSDATPAILLDATVDFDVVGTILTVTVFNQTTLPDEYEIVELFFNSSDDVTGLTLDLAGTKTCPAIQCKWDLFAGSGMTGQTVADGFGFYDWALKSNSNPGKIVAGETFVFEFTIAGVGPFDMSDFATDLSQAPQGDTPALVAAKFVTGPGDDSAFGATVPEPGTFAMLGLGILGLGVIARRRDR